MRVWRAVVGVTVVLGLSNLDPAEGAARLREPVMAADGGMGLG